MKPLYRVLRAIVKPFAVFLFRLKAEGRENIPKDSGFILCCNHTSLSDIIFLGVMCPKQIQFMAKQELFEKKLLGWFFRKLGAFPVNRKSGDLTAIKKAKDVVESGGVLGIFPEGTRHYNSPPQKGKPGAAMIALQTGAKILPVSVYREGKVHIFSRTTVRFGEIFEYPVEADTTPGKTQIKELTNIIMDKITLLWGCGY